MTDAQRTTEQEVMTPIKMILHCPVCHMQHIDAPDNRTADWQNPPHKSHLCHGCGCIWRPCDLPTEGVAAIDTLGKADNWLSPYQITHTLKKMPIIGTLNIDNPHDPRNKELKL